MASKYRTKEEITLDKIEKIREKKLKSELKIENLKGLIKIERMNMKAYDTEIELLMKNVESMAESSDSEEDEDEDVADEEEKAIEKTEEKTEEETEDKESEDVSETITEEISEEIPEEVSEDETSEEDTEEDTEEDKEIPEKSPEEKEELLKKITGFKFSGKNYDTESYISVWDKMLSLLYEINPGILKNLAYDNWGTKKKAYLTSDPSAIPQGKQGKIENSPVIYHRNFTSYEIINNIGKLLERYGMDPSEFEIITE